MNAGMEIFGYRFRNGALLQEALTTPACRMDEPEVRDNQRLEFLGDAILGLLSAEKVFEAFPNDQEGVRLTRMKKNIRRNTARIPITARSPVLNP